MARPQRISNHILPAARSNNLWGIGEAADDGHAGEVGGGGGGEGAEEEGGFWGGEAGEGAEGCEEGHLFFVWEEIGMVWCDGGFKIKMSAREVLSVRCAGYGFV